MTSNVTQVTLGVDVSKDHLDVYDWTRQRHYQVNNSTAAIAQWLGGLTGEVRLALEPTSHYHLAVVDTAHALGYAIYLVNPRQLHHYRYAVGLRHKSDPHDAWLLARYLSHEAQSLPRHCPSDQHSRELWALIKRRAVVVGVRKNMRMSMRQVSLSGREVEQACSRLIQRIECRIEYLLRALGLQQDYARCQQIPGLGPATAAGLVAAFHRGVFASSDAFVAYLGLDIRLRRSGRMQGKHRLTKNGEKEIRRLLFCAAHAARNEPRFERYHQRQLDKGLSKTAARVILGRKLVRIAYALMSRGETFKPCVTMA